jgi:hypothetical protein
MIKHTIKDDLISLTIAKTDFSYRIPLKKIGNICDWKIGEKGAEGIVMKSVSTWALQLFTKKITEEKYVKQFKSIVEECSPKNSIDWDATLLAVTVQNQYNWFVTINNTAEDKLSEKKLISNLKTKYKLA